MRFSVHFFFFILITVILLQGCIQVRSDLLTKKYSPEQLREDATILKEVLLEMHPAVGLYRSPEHYKNHFNNYISSLTDSLTEKEFRLKTKLMIDELHCGHTEVLYSAAFYRAVKNMKMNYSPYIFLPVKDKAYLIANLNKKDSSIKKGVEILMINGVAVDSMLRYSKRYISSDGYNQTAKDHYVQLGFNSYYLGLFGRPDTFNVEYRDGKKIKSAKYPAIRLKNLPTLPLGIKDDSLYINYRRAKIMHRYLDDNKKTMMVRIEKFSHSSDISAYRRIFRKLKNHNSENLVIDLRNNGGGSLANSYRLLSYLIDSTTTQTLRTHVKNYPLKKYTHGNLAFKLTRLAYRIIGEHKSIHDTDYFVYRIKPRKKNHFDKNIYVLINGGSFSASCLVAAYLRKNSNAIFIGEETGGTMEGCNAGITPFYKMPNTKIRVRVPAFRIIHDVAPALTGQGIQPDYKIEYSLKDLTSKRDLELVKVKELLKIK